MKVKLILFVLMFMTVPVFSQLPKGVGATYASHNGVQVCDELQNVNAGWMYNWGTHPTICNGVESVPMLWGVSNVGQPVGGNSEWLMLFNEPLYQGGRTMQEVVVATYQASQLYTQRLVSPSFADTRNLSKWRDEYRQLYGTDPPVDAVAVHCYAWDGQSVNAAVSFCKGQVRKAAKLNLGPVWVTEWAWIGEQDRKAEQYIGRMLKWLGRERKVSRHAYFELSYSGDEPWALPYNTSLTDWQTGQLTNLGVAFRQ